MARQYKVAREEIFRGIRGRENEARKVAMYLVKRCCDRTLAEMAEYFKVGNYSAVGWSCRAIESKMAREKKLRDRIEKIIASTHQLQTLPQGFPVNRSLRVFFDVESPSSLSWNAESELFPTHRY